jgi:hypothetical protein
MDKFREDVEKLRKDLTALLFDLKRQGHRIVGVSAPAKGNTLLNYCKIGPETLDYLTEISPLKVGKYSPGQHIPVVHDDKLIEDQPEYALILACNFKKNIIKAVKNKGYKGKFIIPYPELEIE